ncbi:MAG: adenosylcobalamin-dependent ribonucleoside-diphosphate reductase [Dissulfurispiraceae bacterium]|jgi:ribonucleoside-diphosphate reductase alpha chain|nr:adenosylcobalamin-dependent ribonucleoside-diphosphate reductase [Dissulfurispiraceae bacterium]
MQLTDNAIKVLEARYLLRDEKTGIVETPEQMFRRVSAAVASSEEIYNSRSSEWEEKFFEITSSLRFLPNSPALMNAGRLSGQLAACFVLPLEDSMNSIFDTLKNAALILQSGGGTGFSFSRLRPRSDAVRSTGGIESGPVSFIKIYNTATEVIKQGGVRRGANMGVLRIDHPDILEFVRAKRIHDHLENFNISVAVTDEFMSALADDKYYQLVNPRTKGIDRMISAKEVFDEIVLSAWETGDPGLLFIDRINRANPTPLLGSFETTNPCGEQPLLPYEACVLGSLNLSAYVNSKAIDYEGLSRDISVAVRFLDNMIDASWYPLKEIEQMHNGNRKIGLGVMGWADMLIKLEIPYDSQKAFDTAGAVMSFINKKSKEASAELAAVRGVFPNFKGSVYDSSSMPRVRNATTTTIAPTGSLSVIADCSSGIEPIFSLSYKRYVLDTEFTEVNKYFMQTAKERKFDSDDVIENVMRKGSCRGLSGVPLDIKRIFKTAHEIKPVAHIKMQAAFQRFTDNAVSKTINLPHTASKSDVAEAFLYAYDKGVKGITIFRYGSKKGTLFHGRRSR